MFPALTYINKVFEVLNQVSKLLKMVGPSLCVGRQETKESTNDTTCVATSILTCRTTETHNTTTQ